jgi:hypothetical protein
MALALGACGVLLPALNADPPPDPPPAAAGGSTAAAPGDQELAAKLDAAGREIEQMGATAARALDYTALAVAAHEGGAVARGKVYGPTVVRTGLAAIEGARAAEPARAPDLLVAQARLELLRGRPERALAAHVEALGLAPRPDILFSLAALPPSPERAAALADACPKVRPAVGGSALPDFVAVCLDAVGGDARKLGWKDARADVEAWRIEMARRESEARLREEEERRRREEEARLAAEAAVRSAGHASAAVFAAGRCEFSDCGKNGWTAPTPAGDVRTRCSFSRCLENGWETTFPDGSRATTRCSFSRCLENGWETSFSDGSRATTRCSFSKCAENGWETELPDGRRSATRCRFSKCFENGWDTSLPDGRSVGCTCRFSDCVGNGADCG